MKNTLILSIAFFGLSLPLASAMADDGDFEKHKQEAAAHVDEKIQKLTEHKGCITAAADKDALKACREKMKAWHMSERTEHMEKRKGRIDEKIKRLEQKKGELK